MKAFSSVTIVLNNIERALVAEEKQGFANTGALGGFSTFLSGVVPRLGQLVPGAELSLIREIAGRYPTLSPLKRREGFVALQAEFARLRRAVEENNVGNGGTGGNIGDDGRDSNLGDATDIKLNAESGEKSTLYAESQTFPRAETGSSRPETVRRSLSLQYLKGVGPERCKQLQGLGIERMMDLILYFPRRYEDRRFRPIGEIQDGEMASITGTVVSGQLSQGRVKVVKLGLEQEGRVIQAVWFNQPFILKQYPIGTHVAVTGKLRRQRQYIEILAADIEKLSNLSSPMGAGGIVPVYSETARLSTKVIRTIMQQAIPHVAELFPEFLASEEQGDWMPRSEAYRHIHFPPSYPVLARARERLVWEEILLLQLAIAKLKSHQGKKEPSPVLVGGGKLLEQFFRSLPFGLTKAQQRVIEEIYQDMAREKGMARLVQGDVGSGKTAVAMAALLKAVASGYQGAMMAPTEILALQHAESLKKAFDSLDVDVVLLLGSQGKQEREDILARIADGRADVVVGTHALIQEDVNFRALGLAITDEQHRFGVRQRSLLQGKGGSPHVLVLTATPIPRTLALTLYGDLQLSVIDELPAGRKPIVTKRLSERGRPSLEKFMEEQITRGRQIYVVCPLVQESEALDLVSAEQRAESLQKRFPHRTVMLLHGRMKGAEKEDIMHRFQAGEINILVSTTVVEVGVNVPNATVMVIEGAERFGLAQLHQLRGRVGRGTEQSFCILMSEARSSRRLEVLCETQDGFKIAEEDLKLRGPGELLGTRQHGLPELRLADLSQDALLVEKAYRFAQKVLQDPKRYRALFEEVERIYRPEKAGLN